MTEPFVPPIYPFEKLAPFEAAAKQLDGGVVDLSVGAPVDPPVPGAAAPAVPHNGGDRDGQGPAAARRGESSTGAGNTAEDTAEDTAGAPDRARTAPLTTTDPDGEHS